MSNYDFIYIISHYYIHKFQKVLVIMLQASVTPSDLPSVLSANSFLRTLGGILGVQIFQIILQTWLSNHINFLSNTDNLTRNIILGLPAEQQAVVS